MQRGRGVFVDREGGHCLLCHSVSGLDAPFQGDLAPDLAGVGARLSLGQIRLQIVDAALINPDTIMPSYYRTHGFHQVGNSYAGAPALSSQDVEDLAAFLASLKETPG
ncbi:MAG: sulfur oxidation c-type cytochrome SoxX [Pseudomonadota bacterium]